METVHKTKIIAFEGIDGSGKSLQYRRLTEALRQRGYCVDCMDFPAYDDFFGKEIGRMLSGSETVTADTVDAKSMSLWYALDRLQAFRHYDLTKSDFLLLNRSSLSNAVYQSTRCPEPERRAMIQWIDCLEFEQLAIPKPDLYIVFDILPEQSKENVAKKGHREYIGEKADVYEAKVGFMEAVRSAYLVAAEIFDNVEIMNCMAPEGGMLSVDVIGNRVLQLAENLRSVH